MLAFTRLTGLLSVNQISIVVKIQFTFSSQSKTTSLGWRHSYHIEERGKKFFFQKQFFVFEIVLCKVALIKKTLDFFIYGREIFFGLSSAMNCWALWKTSTRLVGIVSPTVCQHPKRGKLLPMSGHWIIIFFLIFLTKGIALRDNSGASYLHLNILYLNSHIASGTTEIPQQYLLCTV